MLMYFLVDNENGSQIRVDVETCSCSCVDFKENRKKYECNDPRRMCKHLIEALAINEQWIDRTEDALHKIISYCFVTRSGYPTRRRELEEIRALIDMDVDSLSALSADGYRMKLLMPDNIRRLVKKQKSAYGNSLSVN